LRQVRSSGEEIIIRDRNLPVAKLVPLVPVDVSVEELVLAASGEMTLPTQAFDANRFWSIGAGLDVSPGTVEAAIRAVSEERDEREDGVLGR
jgi:antitoxin (DNA-binding transcriptional repressor) of toxin-antitoxin stability system